MFSVKRVDSGGWLIVMIVIEYGGFGFGSIRSS